MSYVCATKVYDSPNTLGSKLQLPPTREIPETSVEYYIFLGNNYICFHYFTYSALCSDSRGFVFPCPE